MDDQLAAVAASLRELQQSVRAIEQRLALVEMSLQAVSLSPTDVATEASIEAPVGASPDRISHDVVSVMSFIGRTCVALGGAYLLRALTDATILPPPVGIVCGFAYGAVWLVMADRAAADGRRLSAAFHAAVTSMIGFPLLWEAVTRFTLLGPETSALVMAALTAAALVVAARQRLQSVAWIVVAPAVITSVMLIAATGFVLPSARFLIALGVATLWLGYLPLYWRFLRWPVAFAADLSVLALGMRVAAHASSDPPAAVIAVQLLLLTSYLASIMVRTLVRGRDVIPFEIVQATLALAVGFGGAVYVAAVTGAGERALAAINLAAGCGCYAVAFAFVARRQGVRHNFYFYTSLAIALVVVSTHMLLPRDAAGVTFAALAVVSAWTAWRVGQIALNLHAAGYVLAAATETGLLSSSAYALMAEASAPWPAFTTAGLLTLSATFICWLIPLSSRAESWGAYSRLPRLVITTVLAWSLGGAVVALLTTMLTGVPGSGAQAGAVATIRTTVLATSALALAWAGGVDRFSESARLVYPVLVACALKLVVQDLRDSKPATLFVALAFYGGALILAPRVMRRRVISSPS